MSNDDLNDLLKDFAPTIDLSSHLTDQFKTFDPSILEPHAPDINPDDFAPNRTAKSAEAMVEILKSMSDRLDEVEQSQADMTVQISAIQDESRSAESRNRDLTYILIGIGVLTLLATIVGLYV